jgi:CRP/FNR family transcriptional regulator
MTNRHLQTSDIPSYLSVHRPVRQTRRTCTESDWSSLREVIGLLRYDGHCSADLDEPVFRRRRVQAGQSVFVMGQAFGGLYVVRHGALKTVLTHPNGNAHVLSFSMKGDLLGAEGSCQQHYWCETFALSDCEVIRLPVDDYFHHGRAGDGVERMLYWAISREVAQRQAAYAVSHAAKSEVRVARFLLDQSKHFSAMGYSPRCFTLPMTRRDIGSFLSVTLETVSRALSTLSHMGIIEVSGRNITIHCMESLQSYEG